METLAIHPRSDPRSIVQLVIKARSLLARTTVKSCTYAPALLGPPYYRALDLLELARGNSYCLTSHEPNSRALLGPILPWSWRYSYLFTQTLFWNKWTICARAKQTSCFFHGHPYAGRYSRRRKRHGHARPSMIDRQPVCSLHRRGQGLLPHGRGDSG